MQVANAFHRARNYDRHAIVQRNVAQDLAERILALDLQEPIQVLEIGCGTGFLGANLIDRLPYDHYCMTDIAPGMLDRARQHFGMAERVSFVEMDGARPNVAGPFQLICSSLAMQWLPDLGAAVDRLRQLLAPEGWLAFTTLAAGSFAQWRAAYGEVLSGTPDYPTVDALHALGLEVTIDTIDHSYGSARDFLTALKAIGAGTPRAGYRPLSLPLFRRVMKRFEREGAQARYVIATCIAGPK